MLYGFNFVQIERLGLSGSDRLCAAWAKSGMHLGVWNDIQTIIDRRAAKGFATQVYVRGTFGATRVEEGKVLQIKCAE